MLMLRLLLPVRDLASVACTVKVALTIVVGVPVIAPVPLSKLNPAGKLPVVMLQVKGGVPVPLVTCTAALYRTLTATFGKLDSKITGGTGGAGLEPPPHAARNTQRISANPSAANRSEERRVGEEGRFRLL